MSTRERSFLCLRGVRAILWLSLPAALGTAAPGALPTSLSVWFTNPPAVYTRSTNSITNFHPAPLPKPGREFIPIVQTTTSVRFQYFFPESLNYVVWTNLLAQTNGRTMTLWSARVHPTNWPAASPQIRWNTNSLIWGMKGFTALSPCWEGEGAAGQAPVTALTRRHGYTRGHSMGADGLTSARTGKKVWFVGPNNELIEIRIAGALIRTLPHAGRDYTILLFEQDLPKAITPLRACRSSVLNAKYPHRDLALSPVLKTEQGGNVSAGLPGFSIDTWKGGDSGSPDLLPLPGELVFIGGRSTSSPSTEMQADMNILSRSAGLAPERYQMQWVDLSAFPSYDDQN
jgi:hypothetical protein